MDIKTVGYVAKEATKVAAEIGVGTIVGGACAKVIPEGLNPVTKVCCVVGAGVLGGIAGEKACDYIDELSDELVACVKTIKEVRKLNKEIREAKKVIKTKIKEGDYESESDTESVEE